MKKMNDEWVDTFRTIIHRYNCQRISDPFMVWFREQNQKTTYTINDKVLLVLIDARFDQQTTAEKALENAELTESPKSNLSQNLSQNLSELGGQFPELIHIMERWPALPGHIKEAIKSLTQFENNHTNSKEDQ